MAAIDPDETPEHEDGIDPSRPRATLKLIRPPPGLNLDEEDDEDSEDEYDEDSDEEETNGGPSDKEKARKLKEAAALKEMEEDDDDEDEDDEDDGDFDLQAAISKLVKGKSPAIGDDDDDDESEESLDVDEAVVCTLDPEKNYQQPLDITVAEGERIFFKVTGTHSIFLTGNYVMPLDDHHHDDDEDEDEDDYDLSPDEDELDMDIMDEDGEEDDLDGLDDPRITEVDSDEEAPKLVNTKSEKGKNKRAAAEAEESLDDLMTKEKKPVAKAEEGLSKKQQKKMKKNNGEAAEPEQKKDGKDAKEGKKVQFAKNLEQGPTPSPQEKKPADATTGTLGVKNVGGVTIDDKKLGKGVAAKAGNSVSMRYIGKLENGKVFDCTLSPTFPPARDWLLT